MEQKSKNERLQDGEILVRTIIEMLGAPKDHIVQTMKDYVEKLKEHTSDGKKDFVIVKSFIAEPEEQENKMWSLYAELEIWFVSIDRLMAFCFDSLPSSIEILEPTEIRFKSNDLAGNLNDLQAKLHLLDATLKRLMTDQQAAAVNFQAIVNNFIRYCQKHGVTNSGEMSNITGIDKKRIDKWIADKMANNTPITKTAVTQEAKKE